jgi:hypothetical protein
MEMLEHRLVLSTSFLVTNAQDSGDGSLRWAVEQTNETSGGDTITFDASLIGQAIVLGGTELTVSDDLSITGLGADKLTISGNNASRVFSIAAGVTVDISAVTIADGKAYEYENGTAVEGGGIYNKGTLTVADCTLTNNAAWWDGGAIYNLATLIVIDSILSSNSGSWGGAICNYSPDVGFPSSVTITNSTLTLNDGDEGGAIWSDGLLKVTDSAFSSNSSWSTGGAVWNSGTLDITNGMLTGNRTDGEGGGIYNAGTLSVENGSFTENDAG